MIDGLGFRGSTVMQTKSPFSCWDRSPSNANVTGLNNRRDVRGVRHNRRFELRSGVWAEDQQIWTSQSHLS